MISKYKDFIGFGSEHSVWYIDDDFILKVPVKYHSISSLKTTSKFDAHIKFMQQYPDIFPNVKKLDKYRASIEKVDIEKAVEEIKHVAQISAALMSNTKKFSKIFRDKFISMNLSNKKVIMHYLYNKFDTKKSDEVAHMVLIALKEYGLLHNDEIVNKWVNFIEKLKTVFDYRYLDLHSHNFGIDKNNQIKLVDF
jgi:hypothetical protein